MTKRKKRPAGFSARQSTRNQQRGHLQRSTIFALFGMAFLGICLIQGYRLFENREQASRDFIIWTAARGFSIQQVNVVGRNRVPPDVVMQGLGITRGMPILDYDPKLAQETLAQNPWFKSVHIERRLPDTIFVRLKERKPVARWQYDRKLALVDADGIALATDNLEQYRHLPIIIGQDARTKILDLFDILKAEPDISKDIASATWVGNRRWDLKMKNQIVIRLPAQDSATAFGHMAKLNREQNILKRDLVSVDLRLPGKAVLQPTTRANAVIERPDFNDTPDKSKKNI